MHNKNLMLAIAAAFLSNTSSLLVCAEDFTKKIDAFDIRVRETNLLAKQAIEQSHRIEYKTDGIAKQLTALQKQMRPSLLKRFTKSTILIGIGALAEKLYSKPELIEQGSEKITRMWHATNEQEVSTKASINSTESNSEEKK